jgi:amino acid transporter
VSHQGREAEQDVDRPSDDLPLPRWVGHPAVRYPAIAVIWGTVFAFLRLDGDAEALVGFSLMITVMALVIFSGVQILRRKVPQYYLHSISPVTVIIWSLAFIFVSATVLFDLAVNPPTDELEWKGGFWVAGLLIVASIFVQLYSMTDAWPDRLRPRLETPEWKQRWGRRDGGR